MSARGTLTWICFTDKREREVAETVNCDLNHPRPARAVVKLQIKSTRANKPGHPMVRVLGVCATHVRQLRDLGFELVDARRP